MQKFALKMLFPCRDVSRIYFAAMMRGVAAGEIFVTFASSARHILSFIYRDGPDIAHSKGTFLQMSGAIC